jgi:hypothetical protein
MRNITKIALLLVVAFFVYLIWPRTPDLKGFDPVALSKLELKVWKAEKEKRGFAALMARYQIYTSQYHLSPAAAFLAARSAGNGIDGINEMRLINSQRSPEQGPDTAAEGRAIIDLTEGYARMKGDAKTDFDPDAIAREEFAWRMLLLDGAPADEVAKPISRILALIYGGPASDFQDVAAYLAYAQTLTFGAEPPADVTNPAQAAEEAAIEGNKQLKQIATMPVPAATPES